MNRTETAPKGPRFWTAWTLSWAAVFGLALAHLAWRHGDRTADRPALARLSSPVPTPSKKTKSIETIAPGDRVLARNDVTGEVAPRRVAQVFRNTADHLRTVRIRSDSGTVQELKTTDDHPFFVVGRGWVLARSLEPGNKVLQPDGREAEVDSTSREAHPEGVAVFNFEVAEFHTYFVAETANDPFVLVHNDCVARAEAAAARHGGTRMPGTDNWSFPTRRAARQAASEIAGNLGSDPVPIRMRDFRGKPPGFNPNSEMVHGQKSADGSILWRDDFLGHPRFGAGPHVNVEIDGHNFHLFY